MMSDLLELAAIYSLPGFALLAWGWRDAMETKEAGGLNNAALILASVAVVLSWPYGGVVRARNDLRNRRFAAALRSRNTPGGQDDKG
jgi:hypothetical protein